MNNHNFGDIVVREGAHAHLGDGIHTFTTPPDLRLLLRDCLAYEGAYARNEQLQSQYVPPNSFKWIWSTSFKRWLSRSDSLYWITGKPGSGKSTLIQYLSHAEKTRKHLNSNRATFKVLYFFFDYRAGGSVANNECGLIKCFLSQLCDHFPDMEGHLANMNRRGSLKDASTNHLLGVLCHVLQSLSTRICAFIDGLDEYTGDYAHLTQFLTTLQERNTFKLCLASRPEAIFKRLYADLPSLAMQDHNAGSIKLYIDAALSRANAALINTESIIDESLRQNLLDRAQGVIIWARFAVDELIQVARSTSSRQTLETLLENLPEDLTDMYERTFVRIAPEHTAEAALLLFLINELGGAVDLEVLYGFWSFLQAEVLQNTSVNRLVERKFLRKRLPALLGSLIDMHSRPVSWYNVVFEKMRKRSSEKDEVVQVRLIHQTLRQALKRTGLVMSSLHREIHNRYPDNSKARLLVDVIAAATNENSFKVLAMQICQSPRNFGEVDTTILAEHIADEKWARRGGSLVYCIKEFHESVHDLSTPCASIYRTWSRALKSPLLLLNLTSETKSLLRRHLYEYPEFIDLTHAVQHRIPIYILEATALDVTPPPSMWSDLLASLLHGLFHEIYAHYFKQVGHCDLYRGSHGDSRIALLKSQTLIWLISPRCGIITDKLLWTIIDFIEASRNSVINSYSTIVEQSFRIAYETLFSIRHIPACPILYSTPQLCDASCSIHHHILSEWIQKKIFRKTVYPSFPWATYIDGIERFSVRALSESNNINHICTKSGKSLMHVLMTTIIQNPHTWKMGASIDILIVLAGLGADPDIEYKGKTPLQMLQALKTRNLHDMYILIEILEHHQKHGLWPDFGSIIRTRGLRGPALWQFDDHGRIILEPIAITDKNNSEGTMSEVVQAHSVQVSTEASLLTKSSIIEQYQAKNEDDFVKSGACAVGVDLRSTRVLPSETATAVPQAARREDRLEIPKELIKCGDFSVEDWF